MSAQARMSSARVAAIVLAAGRSARMGPLGNKLLQEVGGRPLVARVVDALIAAAADPILVVTGFERDRVEAALAGRGCRFVEHAGWADGMGSSLARGARVLQREALAREAVLVCVGDLPGLRAEHVARVVEAAREEGGRIDFERIVVPTRGGRPGHPVLFGWKLLDALAKLSGDEGGRSIVAARPGTSRRVEVADEAILRDVDTPAALEAARRDARVGDGEGSG